MALLNQTSIPDIVSQAKKGLAEIRKREARREREQAGPREVFHAQILSFTR